jgi:acid phosphatase family membrane protein YuiD
MGANSCVPGRNRSNDCHGPIRIVFHSGHKQLHRVQQDSLLNHHVADDCSRSHRDVSSGLVEKDGYAQRTALWTGEALADSAITAELLKLITRRARPEAIPPDGNFGDTWLDARTVTDGGFPSGHTIMAFSVATVMSRRYGHNHRWVPFAAYGAATAIGLSRVTLSAHNVSDVFVGASLGYAISRFVVLGRIPSR